MTWKFPLLFSDGKNSNKLLSWLFHLSFPSEIEDTLFLYLQLLSTKMFTQRKSRIFQWHTVLSLSHHTETLLSSRLTVLEFLKDWRGGEAEKMGPESCVGLQVPRRGGSPGLLAAVPHLRKRSWPFSGSWTACFRTMVKFIDSWPKKGFNYKLTTSIFVWFIYCDFSTHFPFSEKTSLWGLNKWLPSWQARAQKGNLGCPSSPPTPAVKRHPDAWTVTKERRDGFWFLNAPQD